MTGGDLRIEGPEMKITAQDKFEYFSGEGKMVVYGAPVVTNRGTVLTADRLTAWTDPDAAKNRDAAAGTQKSKLGNLKRAEADGHVVVTTPKEKATADRGVYTGATDMVELLGNVKLNQGENYLEGVKADMNLTTNLSRIYGAGQGGRVKGVFYPASKKTDKK